jgi:GNAT superfamily N-acetyltransferase
LAFAVLVASASIRAESPLNGGDVAATRSTVRPSFVEVSGDALKDLKQEKAAYVEAYLAAYRSLSDNDLSPRDASSTVEAIRNYGYLYAYFEQGVLNRKKWLEALLNERLDAALKDFDAAYHELRKPFYRVISIRMGDKPVGIAIYLKEDKAGESIFLVELAIHPIYWNHHLGSMMVAYDYVTFLFPHAKKVRLAMMLKNKQGRLFYERKGFKESQQVVRDYGLNPALYIGYELVGYELAFWLHNA